jgi:hypothetical protein
MDNKPKGRLIGQIARELTELEKFKPRQDVAEAVAVAQNLVGDENAPKVTKLKKLKKLHTIKYPERAKSWQRIPTGGSMAEILKYIQSMRQD